MQKFVDVFRPLISGMLILFLTIIVPFNLTAQSGKLKVYVWDFTTRDRIKDDLTRKFNVEFEEALIQNKYYDVLLRRDYDKVFSQKTNEKGILSIGGITKPQLDTLKILQADAIVFGEIYDDSEGGVIRITISLQAFNSKILAQHSTLLRRESRDDPVSREKEMSNLVRKFMCDNKTNDGLRSLLPGLGQFHKNQYKKDWIFVGTEATFFTTALISLSLRNSSHNKAINTSTQSARDHYNESTTTARDTILKVKEKIKKV